MKIRVTTAFNDRQNGYVTRPVNEVFECSESRTEDLQIALLSKRRDEQSPYSGQSSRFLQ